MTDLPYWSSQNMYVYKEVWVHSTGRWLWLMQDLLGPPPAMPAASDFTVTSSTTPAGDVIVRLTTTSTRQRTFALRAANLSVDRPVRSVSAVAGKSATIEWRTRPKATDIPWVAVVIPDGDASRRREVVASVTTAPTQP